MAVDPTRLYTALLNTGLQQRDNPLYQVIHDIIGSLQSVTVRTNIIGSSGSGNTSITNEIVQILDSGGSNEDNYETAIRPNPGIQDLISNFTKGSVIFAGPSGYLAQNNSKFFWDDTNFRLGIGTVTPGADIHIKKTSGFAFLNSECTDPNGTSVFRSTGDFGLITFTQYGSTAPGTYAGIAFANLSLLEATGSNTIISYDNGNLIFANGTVEVARLTHAGLLGIGDTAPTYSIDVLKSLIGPLGIRVKNTSTGAGNVHASIFVENSSSYGQLFKAGTGYSGYKNINAQDLGFFNITAGNISVLCDSGNVNFQWDSVSSTPQMAIDFTTGVTTSVHTPVGIGLMGSTPGAYLHIHAGTATALTAPMKFNAGVLLTTPEIGAVEFVDNGTTGHLYVTLNVAGVLTRVQIV